MRFAHFISFLSLATFAHAEEKPLFNGTNLDGWKGLPPFWSVQDGAIVGETTETSPTKGNTFLVWQGGEVEDFELSCVVRFRGNNSGVQYRSSIVDEANFVMAGYQADLHQNQDYFGMLYGEKMGKRGIIARRGQRVEIRPGGETEVTGQVGDGAALTDWEWNTLRVVAAGDRLVHQINGVTTVDVTDRHPEAPGSGVIGLQLHGGPPMRVEFKEIRLRRLSGEQARAVLEEALKTGGGTPQAASPVPVPAASPGQRDAAWLAGDESLQWIWDAAGAGPRQELWFRRCFEIPEGATVASARAYATCDNTMDLWINGKKVGHSRDWPHPVELADAAPFLVAGENVIAVRGQNAGGTAALIVKLEATLADGRVLSVASGPDWKMTGETPGEGWQEAGYDDASWQGRLAARGRMGTGPWGIPGYGDRPAGGNAPAKRSPLPPEDITVAEGFHVELIYAVPREEQGSWVALTAGPGGKLYASDQNQAGIYEITPPAPGSSEGVKVEKIPAEVSGAQGMTWHQGSLYANLSGKPMVRLHDSTGDGKLDAVEPLPGASGGGEHGNHAVIPAEDGRLLYVAAGNFTNLPDYSASRVPTWDEDLLLPRQWDARGHARGRLAPGGWVAAFDPESQDYEIFATGYRNQYDIALNRHGDLFTFDADMEWDMGMPWYRPTRICFVASGSDHGWRSGTGKWPAYYEDSLPPVVDIGPGSPTGMLAGLELKFPPRYQEALFALDWTFGTLYAIHLQAQGAGYTGEAEPFLHGAPLPVTDAAAGEDGALYFTVGGRNTQSALYRVTWRGEAAPPAPAEDPGAAPAREIRRELEAFHGKPHPEAIAKAWPHLASEDRFLRHAARVAVESQPVAEWAARLFDEIRPQARVTGAVALARSPGAAEYQGPLLASLLALDPASLSDSQLLGWLRAHALAFSRLGRPGSAQREALVAALDPLLPHANPDVNTELVQILVYLQAPSVIGKTLELIAGRGAPEIPDWSELASRNPGYGGKIQELMGDHPPSREIGYAFMLGNLKTGWTLEQRRTYFEFLNAAAKHSGGASYTGFLANLRDEALGNCSNEERAALADVTGEDFNPVPDFPITPPQGPGQAWTMESAAPHASTGAMRQASFANGRSLFHAAACAACHRFGGLGGDIGPDLTSMKNKFDAAYVLESIIDPGKVISDQYGSSAVTLKSGQVHVGLVVERGDAVEIYPPSAEAEPVVVPASEVASVEPVSVSQMPPGLINGLNAEELRDLMAYLMSGGDPADKVYGGN